MQISGPQDVGTGRTSPDKNADMSGQPDTDNQTTVRTGPDTVLSLQQAARVLKIKPDALRKRIERGTVHGYKEDGRLFVVLDNLDRTPDKRPGKVDRKPDIGQDTSGQADTDTLRDLYERLLTATEEATRYKAIAEVSESTRREAEEQYRAMIAELQHERKILEQRAAELEIERATMKQNRAALEAELQRRRPWWRRRKAPAGGQTPEA